MNRNRNTRSNGAFGGVDGAFECAEPKLVEFAFHFARRKIRKKNSGVLVHLFCKECSIEVITVQMRDVEKIRVAHIVHDVWRQLIVTREDKP